MLVQEVMSGPDKENWTFYEVQKGKKHNALSYEVQHKYIIHSGNKCNLTSLASLAEGKMEMKIEIFSYNKHIHNMVARKIYYWRLFNFHQLKR